jgi:hypothetical protein
MKTEDKVVIAKAVVGGLVAIPMVMIGKFVGIAVGIGVGVGMAFGVADVSVDAIRRLIDERRAAKQVDQS